MEGETQESTRYRIGLDEISGSPMINVIVYDPAIV